MAQLQVAANGCATQVQIAVFHAQIIAAIALILNGERWRYTLVQHIQLGGNDFDVARGQVLVLVGTLADAARYLDNVFASQPIGLLKEVSPLFRGT